MENSQKTSDYSAKKIQVMGNKFIDNLPLARQVLNANEVSGLVQKRGDLKRVAFDFNIDGSVLFRFLIEFAILKLFPTLSRSKAGPLSTFSSEKVIF